MAEFMLTTVDNPYSPFTNFDQWLNFDLEKGYNTCQLLARVSRSTPNLGPKVEAQQVDDAMNDIVNQFAPLYFKLEKNDKISLPISSIDVLIDEIEAEDMELTHHGIQGQKWGVRRFQNKDGSFTEAGRERYGIKRRVTTKHGETITVEEVPKAKLTKLLSKLSPRISEESERTMDFEIKDASEKKIGDLMLYKESNTSLNINWIGIRNPLRGKGYASSVMQDVINFAKESGFKQLTLEVPGESPDARHIYEKLGFKEVETVSSDDLWEGLTAMKLDLTKVKRNR